MDIFSYVAESAGVPIGQVIFLSTQIVSVIVGVFFRTALSPVRTSTTTRHVFGAVMGLMLLYWCYGWTLLHMVAQFLGVYAIMMFLPHHLNYKIAFIFAMIYLIFVQVTRLRGIPSFSSPVMFGTTKLVGLVFSIHDGVHKKRETLGPFQQKYAIREYPKFMEVFGYVFHFSGLICGPTFFFKEYMDFISGKNYFPENPKEIQNNNSNGNGHNGLHSSNGNGHYKHDDLSKLYAQVVPTKEVVKKVVYGIIFLVIYLFILSKFPAELNGDMDFIESHGFLYRFMYINVMVFFYRYRYYFAWLFGEAAQNASGLGLCYEDGRPKWNLTTNVNIFKLDFVTSLKDIVDNWNITVGYWLRLVVYERANKKYRVYLTFALSSLWHGLEPGFFLTATICALMVTAAKKVRRVVRPYFLNTRWKLWYDIFTGISAHVAISYSMGGFYLLTWKESYQFFTHSMYWWLHILTILTLIVPLPTAKSKEKEKST